MRENSQVDVTWLLGDGRIEVTELEALARADRDEVEGERLALERFHA